MHIHNLSKEWTSVPLFTDISFSLSLGERLALVGPNGTGKSTLLKILFGEIEKDSGIIDIDSSDSMGYISQDLENLPSLSVFEYIKNGINIKNKKKQSDWELEKRIDIALIALNLSLQKFSSIKNLSEGQKVKTLLASIVVFEPDIVLLDEPTNNIDRESVAWLGQYILQYKGKIILVSHDETFIDLLATKLLIIDWRTKTAVVRSGNYGDHRKETERGILNQDKIHTLQKADIKNKREEAENLKRKAEKGSRYRDSDHDKHIQGYYREKASGSAKRAKALESQIGHIEIIKKPKAKKELSIDIEAKNRGGLITVEKLSFGYTDFKVFCEFLSIPFGSRVLIIGSNGSGKSSFLKTLAKTVEPLSGTVEYSKGVTLGNFSQDHSNFRGKETVMEYLSRECRELSVTDIARLLESYQFEPSSLFNTLDELSSGQKARILFAIFSYQKVNTLFFDEPTNHLDIDAQDALLSVIKNFTGTLVVISHDEKLIEEIFFDIVLSFEGGKIVKRR